MAGRKNVTYTGIADIMEISPFRGEPSKTYRWVRNPETGQHDLVEGGPVVAAADIEYFETFPNDAYHTFTVVDAAEAKAAATAEETPGR